MHSLKCLPRTRSLAHRNSCTVSVRAADKTEQDRESQIRQETTRRIIAAGREGRPKQAINELASMASMGVQPDTQAATALIDACVRSNKVEMAITVFEELFEDDLGLVPDEVTFTCILKGMGTIDPPRWTDMSNLLNKMQNSYGIQPSIATFNILLSVCSRTNDTIRGGEIVERMVALGIEPDAKSYDLTKNRKTIRSLLKKTF